MNEDSYIHCCFCSKQRTVAIALIMQFTQLTGSLTGQTLILNLRPFFLKAPWGPASLCPCPISPACTAHDKIFTLCNWRPSLVASWSDILISNKKSTHCPMMVCFGDALGPCRKQSQPFCADFTSLKIEGQGIDRFQSISQNPTVNPVYDFNFSSLRLRSKNEITKLQKDRDFIPALFLKWNFISMLFHTWKF